MLLYRGPSRLSPTSNIIIIATGLAPRGAANSKTGPLLAQLYIMAEPTPALPTPAALARAGHDRAACGTCPMAGIFRPASASTASAATATAPTPASALSGPSLALLGPLLERVDGTRSCYVNLGQGPAVVMRTYLAGVYEDWTTATRAQIAAAFAGRGVRLGAYGDPAAVPVWLIKAILRRAAFWTGYTHSPDRAPHLKPYCMASAHSPAHALRLQAKGWRTFRVAPKGDTNRMPHELLCPASKEAGHKLTCDQCQACDGQLKGRRANVMIPLHAGARAAVTYAGVVGL